MSRPSSRRRNLLCHLSVSRGCTFRLSNRSRNRNQTPNQRTHMDGTGTNRRPRRRRSLLCHHPTNRRRSRGKNRRSLCRGSGYRRSRTLRNLLYQGPTHCHMDGMAMYHRASDRDSLLCHHPPNRRRSRGKNRRSLCHLSGGRGCTFRRLNRDPNPNPNRLDPHYIGKRTNLPNRYQADPHYIE